MLELYVGLGKLLPTRSERYISAIFGIVHACILGVVSDSDFVLKTIVPKSLKESSSAAIQSWVKHIGKLNT